MQSATQPTIKANELRIGNLIYDHEGVVRVVAYVGDTIGLHNDSGGTQKYQKDPLFSGNIDDLRPIPLSPEILEKAGLVRDKEAWYLSAENMLYDPLERNAVGDYSQRDTRIFAYKHNEHILSRGVRFVHQLQNLFFALTNTELTIEL